MPCACNGGSQPPNEPRFVVKFPDGQRKEVIGEHAAKVEVTLGPPGTTYSRS
jgi:hypothetical protein